jgi:hypothetical protein
LFHANLHDPRNQAFANTEESMIVTSEAHPAVESDVTPVGVAEDSANSSIPPADGCDWSIDETCLANLSPATSWFEELEYTNDSRFESTGTREPRISSDVFAERTVDDGSAPLREDFRPEWGPEFERAENLYPGFSFPSPDIARCNRNASANVPPGMDAISSESFSDGMLVALDVNGWTDSVSSVAQSSGDFGSISNPAPSITAPLFQPRFEKGIQRPVNANTFNLEGDSANQITSTGAAEVGFNDGSNRRRFFGSEFAQHPCQATDSQDSRDPEGNPVSAMDKSSPAPSDAVIPISMTEERVDKAGRPVKSSLVDLADAVRARGRSVTKIDDSSVATESAPSDGETLTEPTCASSASESAPAPHLESGNRFTNDGTVSAKHEQKPDGEIEDSLGRSDLISDSDALGSTSYSVAEYNPGGILQKETNLAELTDSNSLPAGDSSKHACQATGPEERWASPTSSNLGTSADVIETPISREVSNGVTDPSLSIWIVPVSEADSLGVESGLSSSRLESRPL